MTTGAGAPAHVHPSIGQPSAWVSRFARLVGAGEVLDLACGSGRHARLFAQAGHPVLAVDRDAGALAGLAAAGLPGITTLQHDLEVAGLDAAWPFPDGRFAAIVVTNYLHRPLFPKIVAGLAPGGILIYETFAFGNAAFGKPSNPAFLLKPDELLDLCRDSDPALQVLAFEQGHVEAPAPAMVQRLCAWRPVAGAAHTRLRIG